MNKIFRLLTILIITFQSVMVNGQAPSAIPYQAVARDLSGSLIADQNIALRFSIHDSIATGTVIYTETHTATTNTLGLFNVNIGQGTPVTGTFTSINWGSGAKFMQVEMDAAGGTAYVNLGTTQLNSVPYALYAEKANVPGLPGPQGVPGPAGPVDFIGSVNIGYSRNDMVSWTTAMNGSSQDDVSVNVSLGFTVTIKGVNYTTIDLCSNGFLQFGNVGTEPFANSTLPSSLFANPTIFFYWDDMKTAGNGVRYITIGSTGGRVFCADFELSTLNNPYLVTAQVQIHEGSNLVNVRYYLTNTNACGQSATIGIQGAGGATASSFIISHNARVLDDDANPRECISFVMPK